MFTRAQRGAVGAVVVVSSLMVGGCSATTSSTSPTSSPPSEAAASSAAPSTTAALDPTRFTVTDVRDVRFEGFTAPLAGAPYECVGAQDDPQDGLVSLVPCSAVVHAGGDGTADDWLASNGTLLADPSLVRRGDLAGTSGTVLGRFLGVYYPGGHVRPVTLAAGRSEVTGAPGRAYRRQVRIAVHPKGLATTSDTVELVLVQLPSGRDVGWWSVLPDDANHADVVAVEESRASLAVTA